MDAEQLAKRMGAWNASRLAGVDPLRKMPWENLDPISRQLYLERAREFLERYQVKGI